MNQNDYFTLASRQRLRFDSTKGQLSTEDLWELSLESLDALAIQLDTKVTAAKNTRSFIGKRNDSTTLDTLKLEILKAIIEIKQEEAEAAKQRADRESEKQFLRGLLENKRTEKLESLTEAQIEKRLKALE